MRKHCCHFVSIFTFIFLFRVRMFFKNYILLFYRYENNGKAPLILNIILSLHQFYESFSTSYFLDHTNICIILLQNVKKLAANYCYRSATEPQKVNCLILLLKRLHYSFTEMTKFNSLIQSRNYQRHYFEIVA